MTEQSDAKNSQTAQYVEEQLAKLHAALTEACQMIHRLNAGHLRKLITTVDQAMENEARWEGHPEQQYLSPRYFELSSEAHAMRERLAERLARLEGKP